MACQGLCTAKGLAVLPVRYAVVPDTINASLPDWADDPCITGVKLTNNESYALRALRQGYLYVFSEKGKQGTDRWQCYSVASDGSLWLQPVASNPAAVNEPLCHTGEHIAQNVEFISIESPADCGNVWFAFSQYPWEQETLDRYRLKPSARSKRMQKVTPSLTGKQRSQTGTDATESSLNQVLDYQIPAVSGLLPGPDDIKVQDVSRVISLWDAAVDDPWRVSYPVVKLQSTLYPWARHRSGMAVATVMAMKNRSEGMVPLILPLWDPVGIVHELNGWSQDVLGRQAQFVRERELEVVTKTSLDALKAMLSDKTRATAESQIKRMAHPESFLLSDQYLDTRLRTLEARYQSSPEVLAQIRADDRLVREWHARSVPAFHLEDVLLSPPEPLAPHQSRVAAIKTQVEMELASRSRNLTQTMAKSWAPYQMKLNATRQTNFDTCYQSLCETVNELFQQRITSVLNWLDAEQLLAVLDDFHSVRHRAGMFYQSAVGMAIHGINSCPAGAARLDAWWSEFSAKNRENLLWRHVAANNPRLIEELEPLLSLVKARKDEEVTALTAGVVMTALMNAAGGFKSFANYYQMAAEGIAKTLDAGAGKLEVQLFRTDAFIVTVGDRISRNLLVDKAGEKLATTAFRLVFMVRAGVPAETAHGIVSEYLREAPALRHDVLATLRSSERFMANQNQVSVIKQTLSHGLEEHFATEKGKGEYRLARINSLLLVLNAMDFIYLCGQVRNDKKALASLMASGLAMVSQGASVILPAIEYGLQARPLTVAWIKGTGAAAGGVSSLFSVFADGSSAIDELKNNRFCLMTVMAVKTFVDGLAITKSVGLLLEQINKPLSKEAVEKITAFLSYKIFGIRVLAVLMTWEAMVVITLLEVVAVRISDSDLQLWCKKTVFGNAPLNRALNEQDKALQAAIKDIL